ncbi:MAG: ATP-binding cassette domain-containing protein [Gemmatimonadales bacterium]|nr:ATP-binding cassette domain-containing protein [Gemmatimonadales bacterium]
MSAPRLEVTDLAASYVAGGFFRSGRRRVYAVNGVSFALGAGETLGLVGESGSGKTTLARVILRLTPASGGQVRFEGTDLLSLDREGLRAIRRRMQVVFQDPYSSLDPRMRVGETVAEGLLIHRLVPRREAPARVAELLDEVGLPPALAERFPHELSGGQRQRIGIARALGVDPSLVICDEPVSALDVSVQAQVLALLATLQRTRGLSFLFIAHDLAVVRQIAHRIAVMYFGRIVELAPADELVANPRHPYTVALISAVPEPDPDRRGERIVLEGDPPAPTLLPRGCPFAPRCFHARKDARCEREHPELRPVAGTLVACHHAEVDARPLTPYP